MRWVRCVCLSLSALPSLPFRCLSTASPGAPVNQSKAPKIFVSRYGKRLDDRRRFHHQAGMSDRPWTAAACCTDQVAVGRSGDAMSSGDRVSATHSSQESKRWRIRGRP
ncbi:hypothetical protein N658DRAFT_301123 [Parathielavia hyrcaniae]|uniref:Secreted protein n=1 Tax=Parathielavia hyrcaniae TaxID=113614 RepID=A0AAN6Q9C3_9PEZI|nr:hypothetical protein N658DRAFT_301123 [Parathielavia hyrcaniae]